MCNCIDEIRDKLHQDINPHHYLCFTHTCTNINTGERKFQIPFEHDYETKTGKIRTKKTFVSAIYCPVCGTKYGEEEQKNENTHN